jgi:soluble lytic murein transglycosylase-like protein
MPVVAGTIYVYAAPDGSKLITDRPKASDYRLIRKYHTVFDGGDSDSTETANDIWAADASATRSRFDPLIERIARAHSVDSALVKAVVHAESSFNPRAVSHKGATGLMQLMPATADRYGVDDILDPEQNVDGGVRYLRDLLRMFRQDTRLAVAAYNAGENAVLRYQGVPPYNETRHYVQRVLQLHRLYSGT